MLFSAVSFCVGVCFESGAKKKDHPTRTTNDKAKANIVLLSIIWVTQS
jgi:hypothetical protein